MPGCIRAVAAAAIILEEAKKVTMGHPLVIKAPHEICTILSQKAAKYLTPTRYIQYEAAILCDPEVRVELCTTINPATLLPDLEGEEKVHSCIEVLEEELPIRKDLKDQKIDNAEVEFYADGSSYMLDGKRHTGYVVVSDTELIRAGSMSPNLSAQAAEIKY